MSDTVAPVVFLCLGLAGLLYGLVEFRRARDSRHWPVHEAVVLESTIKEHRGGKGGPRYSPFVRYEYRHQGAVFKGQRIMFTGWPLNSTREDVEQFLQPFAKGTRICVHVCPDDPRLSVIEPGVDRRLTLLLSITSFFVFFGIGGLLGWWK
jgi:hypothetical protein